MEGILTQTLASAITSVRLFVIWMESCSVLRAKWVWFGDRHSGLPHSTHVGSGFSCWSSGPAGTSHSLQTPTGPSEIKNPGSPSVKPQQGGLAALYPAFLNVAGYSLGAREGPRKRPQKQIWSNFPTQPRTGRAFWAPGGLKPPNLGWQRIDVGKKREETKDSVVWFLPELIQNVPLLPRAHDARSTGCRCLRFRGRRPNSDLRELLSEVGEKVVARLLRARSKREGKNHVSLWSILKGSGPVPHNPPSS